MVNNNYVFDTQTLRGLLERLINPCDRFILLALYEGICGKAFSEFLKLKLSDFNSETYEVALHTGTIDSDNNEILRKIHVSEELYELAKRAANEIYYYPSNGASRKIEKVRLEGDPALVIKEFPNSSSGDNFSAFTKGRRLRNKIFCISKYLHIPYLTSNKIISSGKVNFVNAQCKKLGISAYEYVYSDNIKNLDTQFGCNTIRAHFYNTYKDYLVCKDDLTHTKTFYDLCDDLKNVYKTKEIYFEMSYGLFDGFSCYLSADSLYSTNSELSLKNKDLSINICPIHIRNIKWDITYDHDVAKTKPEFFCSDTYKMQYDNGMEYTIRIPHD